MPAPQVGEFTVTPAVLRPGEEFAIQVAGEDVEQGVVRIDFRPYSLTNLRLPLVFEDGVATVAGTTPADIPVGLEDFVTFQVEGFSASGEQRVTISEPVPFDSVPVPPSLDVEISEPQVGFLTSATSIEVRGIVGDAAVSVEVNGVTATLINGVFTATVPIAEGRHDIVVIARDEAGCLNTATVSITRDTEPPVLNIEVPSDEATVFMPQITVAGMVNDILPGTVNSDDVFVMINDVPAEVVNRSYEAENFLLKRGENTLKVVATDKAGNSREKEIKVTYQDGAVSQRILIGSGNNQSGLAGSVFADPMLVEVVDRNGGALPDIPVTFEVARGDGMFVRPGADPVSRLTLTSDNEGQAEVFFLAGSRSGEGNNRIKVTSRGFGGEVVFCASVLPTEVAKINALLPAFQVGEPGKALPQPFQVLVTDKTGNPLMGVPVRFRVSAGGGTLDGQSEVVKTTNDSGRIQTVLVLGSEEGTGNHRVIASLMNGPEDQAAIFSASAMTPGVEADTRVIGFALDNGNRPIPGATASIRGTDLVSITNEQGQFFIEDAPVGAVHLIVDGSTTSLPGSWPVIEYTMVTVAGQDNQVDRPIFMPQIDAGSEQLIGGDEDVTVQLDGIPGAEVTVFANSVTGPIGEKEVALRWTQVNQERVPMAPPLGSQFMLAWTVQPAGVRFDPPAQIRIPNMGAPAGQQVEIFSFDHDVEEFVAVGTASVTNDRGQLGSDFSFGLTKSGWGGCVPPPPPAPCKPWESDPPTSDGCVLYEEIPPNDDCDYTRYIPHRLTLKNIRAAANGGNNASLCLNEPLSFTASAECWYGDFQSAGPAAVRWRIKDGEFFDGLPNIDTSIQGRYILEACFSCLSCPELQEQCVSIPVNVSPMNGGFIEKSSIMANGKEVEELVVCVGETIDFSASATVSLCDPSATCELEYLWSFGDGSTGEGASVSHLYETTPPEGESSFQASVFISCPEQEDEIQPILCDVEVKVLEVEGLSFSVAGQEVSEENIKNFVSGANDELENYVVFVDSVSAVSPLPALIVKVNTNPVLLSDAELPESWVLIILEIL